MTNDNDNVQCIIDFVLGKSLLFSLKKVKFIRLVLVFFSCYHGLSIPCNMKWELVGDIDKSIEYFNINF